MEDDFTPDQNPVVQDDFIPDDFTPDDTTFNEPKQSFLSRAWNKVTSPLTNVGSDLMGKFADSIDSPSLDRSPMMARLQGFLGGSLEGAGHLADEFTSPLNLATLGTGMLEGQAAKLGMKGVAKGLEYGTKALSTPVVAHGATELLDPESTWGERGSGLVEIAGGLTGFRNRLANETPKSLPVEEPINLNKGKMVTLPDEYMYDEYGNIQPKDPKVTPPFISPNSNYSGIRPGDINAEFQAIDSKPSKPKVRMHLDGSATDLNTGETIFPNKPAKNSIPVGSEPNLGEVEMQPNLTIKQPTLANISQAVKDGYKFTGQNPDGSYEFQHVGKLGTVTDLKKNSKVDEAFNFPRAVMASNDLSAPLRQGLGLIHKKQFWTSLDDMFRAYGSEEGFRAVQDSISNDSSGLFKPREYVNAKGVKVKKSIAEQSGLALMDLTDLTNREEALASTWAEKIPGVRRGNRAYTAFLNKLRADTFKSLMSDAGHVVGDVDTNRELTKELATFINTATGRGDLGRLEKSASTLNRVFFSPRLIASRLNMLDPRMYIQASPQVRKEALKSLFAITAFGNTVSELGKMAGGTVENDPASSDFRKLKIGNVRVDPFGGFQQYITLASRLISGRMKSSTSGKEYNLSDNKFGRSNRWDVASRFAESKLNPALSFAVDLMKGKDFTGQPFNIPNELAERLTPIIVQDLVQLATENPELLGGMADIIKGQNLHPENMPFAIPSAFGMGIQQYADQKTRR